MGLEANKDLIRRFADVLNAAEWDALDDLLTEDFRRHSQATTDMQECSREEFKLLPCHGEFNCWAKRPRGARTPIGNSQGHCCGPLARH